LILDEDVTVEIQGVDADGFEIISIYLSGKVSFNTTKTLTDREDYQDKDEFDQVVRWQYTN
jgi:ArsR family metal-binding transcriptional regulator